MAPSMQNSHQALASTQMLVSAGPCIWRAAAVLSAQSGEVLRGFRFRALDCSSV